MYHSLLSHSHTGGLVSCFQFATIINEAATNILPLTCVWTYDLNSWDKCPVMKLLHHCSVYFFKKSSDCFPEWSYHFTFPPEMYELFIFSTSLLALILSGYFSLAILISVLWYLIVGLIGISQWLKMVNIFSCACLFIILCKIYLCFCPFSSWTVVFC